MRVSVFASLAFLYALFKKIMVKPN